MRKCLDCQECQLWPSRLHVVWGDGDENADVLFVFEAPGQNEDRAGRPMVDFAMTGQEYNHLLHRMGLNRHRVYTTNLVKCHPPDDRNPMPEEIQACQHHLYYEISVVRPKLIVAAGQFALRFLLQNPDASVEMEHGFVNPGAYNDLDVVADVLPIYHPAAGLHDPIRMLWVQQDFDAIRAAIVGKGKTKPVDEWAGREKYELVTDPAEMEEWLVGNPRISVDTEWARGGPWCMSLSHTLGSAKVVMTKDKGMVKVVADYLANPQVTTIMHNALYDLRVLYKIGIEPGRILDTMVMAYLLHDHQALKVLSNRHLGMKMKEYNDMTGWATRDNALAYLEAVQELGGPWPTPPEVLEFVKGQPKVRQPQSMSRKLHGIMRDLAKKGEAVDPYARWHNIPEHERACVEEQFGVMWRGDLTDIPIEDATYYSGRDADSALRLFFLLRDSVKEQGLWPTLERDMRAMPMVLDMMENGIKPDPVKFAELSAMLGRRMDELAKDIEVETKVTINPGSPQQVADLLFKKLRLRKYKGMSTGDKVLARIAHLHPVVQYIRDWRTYQKLKTSYADVLPTKYLNKRTGRVHTNLRMTRVATGRLSSSNPNLMAQPVRTSEGREIRNGFMAEEGYVFLSADYSQIEMRIPAMAGRDKAMIRIFREDLDIHAETAAMMFGIDVRDVDEMKHRYPAKRVGFGILNDITPAGLLRELVVGGAPPDMWTVGDCADMIVAWFSVYTGIAQLMHDSREFAMRNGYVVDMWGRRRYVPGIRAKNERLREDALRQAGNGPIQMGAQGVIKQAMGDLVPVYRAVNAGRARPPIKPIIQIHDDLVSEILMEEKEMLIHLIAGTMEAVELPIAKEWRVPVPVDPKTGVRWGTLKKERWGYAMEGEVEDRPVVEEPDLYGDEDMELDEAA